MAQSRLQKFASIFNRVEGFLRSGGIKPDDKPIWFDVYKRFPPVVEPIYLRPLPDINVKPIFYHEDKIRAEFYRVFGSPGVIDLMDSSNPTICDLFIEKYVEIAKSSQMNIDDVTLFNLAANRLRESGIRLRKYDGSDNIDLPDVNIDKPAMKPQNPKQNIDIASLMDNE